MNIIKKITFFTFSLITVTLSACGNNVDRLSCFDNNNNALTGECVVISTPSPGEQINIDCSDSNFQPTPGTTCRSLGPGDGWTCPNSNLSPVFDITSPNNFWGSTFPPKSSVFLPTSVNTCSLVLQW